MEQCRYSSAKESRGEAPKHTNSDKVVNCRKLIVGLRHRFRCAGTGKNSLLNGLHCTPRSGRTAVSRWSPSRQISASGCADSLILEATDKLARSKLIKGIKCSSAGWNQLLTWTTIHGVGPIRSL